MGPIQKDTMLERTSEDRTTESQCAGAETSQHNIERKHDVPGQQVENKSIRDLVAHYIVVAENKKNALATVKSLTNDLNEILVDIQRAMRTNNIQELSLDGYMFSTVMRAKREQKKKRARHE
mgnify:CR=1 FL=1